ncbi:MAG: DoxX family membrane protein [Pyrinomonadaceae bacterium]|nr:DoxX family membrane protein [Pyrinomonadaceae bacterium]
MHTLKLILKWILGIAFIAAGINHFINPEFYLNIMPPYLPWHLFLVYLSGFMEIVLGLMLLIPKLQKISAWALIALLLAVFPANIHMALNTDHYPEINPILIFLRLPIQFVIIAWAYWYTRDND